MLDKVFDDYIQAGNSQLNTLSGTGLGTTISKQLIELMGGEIGVTSELNKGSNFWFEIPFRIINTADSDISDNHLLLVASHDVHQIISPSIAHWAISFEYETTLGDVSDILIKAIKRGTPYKTLIIDNSILTDETALEFAQQLHDQNLLNDLSLILVDESGHYMNNSVVEELYISVLHDIHDKRLLFNAIHAANSIHLKSENVVSIADYYNSQAEARSLRILVAEDNKVNQHVIEGILRRSGHEVILAENGEDALDILTAQLEQIDLLIVDKNMPKRSGDEVVQALRFLDTKRDIPVIMLTADASLAAKESSITLGVNEFLTKPIDSRALLGKIAQLSGLASQSKKLAGQKYSNTSQKQFVPKDNVEHIETNLNNIPDEQSDKKDSTATEWCDKSTIEGLLMLDSDPSFMQRLINGFIQDGQKHISLLKKAKQDDYLQYRESLHALKGSASELGANKLADLCKDAESCKPYDIGTEKLELVTENLELAYSNTITALNTVLAKKIEETVS